uniref:Capsid protein n=1 Tax=Cressdnaviricota sp. TaxID=2748378 RepID=A0A6M3YRX7_9VIRU|nr:MAG: capsid protein [Cressdnaviricota sp.]
MPLGRKTNYWSTWKQNNGAFLGVHYNDNQVRKPIQRSAAYTKVNLNRQIMKKNTFNRSFWRHQRSFTGRVKPKASTVSYLHRRKRYTKPYRSLGSLSTRYRRGRKNLRVLRPIRKYAKSQKRLTSELICMRMRYRLNLVVDGNTTEILNVQQVIGTNNLSLTEYNRVRAELSRYNYTHFVGASNSVKRIGDSTMVAAASGNPLVVNAMSSITKQGPRVRTCDNKYNVLASIIANNTGLDQATNVKNIPMSRRGVKTTKYQILKKDYQGISRQTGTLFPAAGATVPASWLNKNIQDIHDLFYENNVNDVFPTQQMYVCDSYPIPALPVAAGSSIANANSLTLEIFTNFYFKGYNPVVNG